MDIILMNHVQSLLKLIHTVSVHKQVIKMQSINEILKKNKCEFGSLIHEALIIQY